MNANIAACFAVNGDPLLWYLRLQRASQQGDIAVRAIALHGSFSWCLGVPYK